MTSTSNTQKPPSLKALSNAVGLSVRRVSQLKSQGMPCHSIEAAAAWKQAQSGSADFSVENLRKERIRLVQEQRQKIAQENQLRAGELIDRAEFGQTIFRVTSEAKMGFMRLSNDLPPKLEGQAAATICKILRAEIINVLRDLSNNFMKSYPDCESNLDKP